MIWRFWRWPKPPLDPIVAMALLVRATDRDTPEWNQIVITRRKDNPDGGVVMAIR